MTKSVFFSVRAETEHFSKQNFSFIVSQLDLRSVVRNNHYRCRRCRCRCVNKKKESYSGQCNVGQK
ncbi:hypothetical protein DERF_011216 [Dermatophagoides farinae]|uniref:Uncharacterized protein n=1 Tax=Dermatophagoides farinae TaxID=6954 RepID=A0A922L2V9_DERFA|nr:hypothetical protein DERF_011216 [Dermatophagoides farinae]